MNRFLPLVMVPLLLSAGLLSAGEPAKNIKVATLAVSQLSKEEQSLTNFFDPGTHVELIVSQPGKRILGLDQGATKVTSFTDDKNTDLNKTNFSGVLDYFSARTSQDGTRLGFRLRSSQVPAKGATKLLLKGKVALKIGAGEKIAEEKNVTLKDNSKIKVGPVEIAKSKNMFGDGNAVEVVYHEPNIKNIAFLGKDGKELPSEYRGGGDSSDGVKTTYMKGYNVKGKIEGMTVRVTYFSKIETVTVPFDLQVGLGF